MNTTLPLQRSLPQKKPRIDGQVTGLAGELFVAAELLKRGLQTSVTFGNAKAIDLFAYNPITRRNFNIQVKTLRRVNYFPIKHDNIDPEHVYVFVMLNEPGKAVQYFVVPGAHLEKQPGIFGQSFTDPKFPCIHPKVLGPYADAWSIFDEKMA